MARKRKPLNRKRRIRALETAPVGSVSNPAALALATRFRNARHGDQRKENARRACRGKVSY